MKFAGRSRLFLDESQVPLNGQKRVFRRKICCFVDVAWKDRRMTHWIRANDHLACWASSNSGQTQCPEKSKWAWWHMDVVMLSQATPHIPAFWALETMKMSNLYFLWMDFSSIILVTRFLSQLKCLASITSCSTDLFQSLAIYYLKTYIILLA